jgi:predicted PurR-regulated permease PerM
MMAPESVPHREPSPFMAFGIAAWAILGGMLVLAASLWTLRRAQVLLAPLVLAVVLMYLLNPVVSRMHRRGVHRLIGSLIAFVLLLGFFGLIGLLVAPSVTSQSGALIDGFPDIFDNTVRETQKIASSIGFADLGLPSYEEFKEFVGAPEQRDALVEQLQGRIGSITSSLLEALLVFFIAPVVAFYLLIDLPRLRNGAIALLPSGSKDEIVFVSRNVGSAIGGFLRGQVLVALIVGILTSAGFALIGLKFWLIIGMIAGVLNIVPFVGPWVGGSLGVIVALATADLSTALWAAGVALIVQQIDNNFVSPNVLRATVRIHPAAIVLVLLLGGAVAGLWGVLLAVPLTGALKIVLGHLWRTRVLGQDWESASEPIIPESDIYEPLFARLRSLESATTPLRSDPPVDSSDGHAWESGGVGSGNGDDVFTDDDDTSGEDRSTS